MTIQIHRRDSAFIYDYDTSAGDLLEASKIFNRRTVALGPDLLEALGIARHLRGYRKLFPFNGKPNSRLKTLKRQTRHPTPIHLNSASCLIEVNMLAAVTLSRRGSWATFPPTSLADLLSALPYG
jgi:hypothetical protein